MILDKLGVEDFCYRDLYISSRLSELSEEFDKFYKTFSQEGFVVFDNYRKSHEQVFSKIQVSEILIDAGKVLEQFIAILFGIQDEVKNLHSKFDGEESIMRLKRDFIKKGQLRKKDVPSDQSENRFKELSIFYNSEIESKEMFFSEDEELTFATIVNKLLDEIKYRNSTEAKDKLAILEEYYFLRKFLYPQTLSQWITSRTPQKLDYDNLVDIIRPEIEIQEVIASNHLRRRDGFTLTDKRAETRTITGEIEYCMICHERDKDSCSTGIVEKTGEFKKNPLGIEIKGCPLDEKISEMHALKEHGYTIGALAMVMIDNPMCAGTGHRICNDCMKGCIFQKQTPVNIPQVETSVLTDVLNLPWGFEIYGLLTRWNPLNIRRPYTLPYNGRNVLVVGLGPAGYTLSHYLMNEGFAVVGVDGLKIEPFPKEMTGTELLPPKPIYNYKAEIEKELDERILEGFGGVSEYGITVRWDKNFLTVLHLLLERRSTFKVLDGVRFGGTLTINDAWELGFDHIALATGAGKPTIIDMKNNLCRGIRKASDFLMSLQLTGAAQKSSMANLQIQLPAIVVGGGLTAIDTATEALAYYPIEVEKFVRQSDKIIQEIGDENYWNLFDKEEKIISKRYREHGELIIEERKRADKNGETPNFLPLLKSWGGVKLIYRKSLQDSPAYRLNHEEVHEALSEGIEIVENMSPVEAHIDEFGAVSALSFECSREQKKETIIFPARSVFIAAGTSPNTLYEKEHPNSLQLSGKYFTSFEIISK
ncbi:MAG: FAD-dependent oxidoreductase [Ignavibacteria bacterium]|nr:FAD-dependent oxidoreductase [Ignavibacteria bacterium]